MSIPQIVEKFHKNQTEIIKSGYSSVKEIDD